MSGTTYNIFKKDTIKVWNISNGNLRHTFNEENGCGVNDLISLGRDNRLIVTGLDNNANYSNIKIWNAEENSLKFTSPQESGAVISLAKIDERIFASTSTSVKDKTIKIWNFY